MSIMVYYIHVANNSGAGKLTRGRVMHVVYEWVIEEMDRSGEEDEIVDVNHADTFQDTIRYTEDNEEGFDVGVVCDLFYIDGGSERGWAYIKGGKLPDNFTDAYDRIIRKVPQRFHREIQEAAQTA